MFEHRRLLEGMIGGICCLVSVVSQVRGGNTLWLASGAVCKVIAALMLIALLAQWEWLSPDRRSLEIGAKAMLTFFSAIAGLTLARYSKEMGHTLFSAVFDLVFIFGFAGAIMFSLSLLLAFKKGPSH